MWDLYWGYICVQESCKKDHSSLGLILVVTQGFYGVSTKGGVPHSPPESLL